MAQFNGDNIENELKRWEPLIHRILRSYNIKLGHPDYEDFSQELRIVVWKVLTDDNPATMYLSDSSAKFETFLFNVLENRLIDVFRVTYKIRLKKPDEEDGAKKTGIKHKTKLEIDKPTANEVAKRRLARPVSVNDLSFEQRVRALKDSVTAEGIRMKTDLDTFNLTLNRMDLAIWEYHLAGWNQEDTADMLKQKGIANKHRSTVSRRLKEIQANFQKFIGEGEL